MTVVISLFNQAGGVGKSTLTQNLGYHLSLRHHKVLLVDIDPQASLTTFMGLEPADLEKTIYDALVSEQDEPLEYTKAKAIAQIKDETERKALLEEAIASSLSLSQIKERVKAAQPLSESPPLATRMATTYQLAKKQKVWDDPKKRKKLESLLSQIEALLSKE